MKTVTLLLLGTLIIGTVTNEFDLKRYSSYGLVPPDMSEFSLFLKELECKQKTSAAENSSEHCVKQQGDEAKETDSDEFDLKRYSSYGLVPPDMSEFSLFLKELECNQKSSSEHCDKHQGDEAKATDSDEFDLKRYSSYGLVPPDMSEFSLFLKELESNQKNSEQCLKHQGDEAKGTVCGIDPTPSSLRMALVGKTGCGKSTSGNTILGRKGFVAKAGGKSVTQNCSKAESDVDGRRVAVVDTPGLFDTSLSNEQVIRETYKSISLLAPGPHAFLLLIQIGRFTAEEKGAVDFIKTAFGKGAEKYIMILFTRGDDLENEDMSIEEYIQNSDDSLKKLIADCGNKFHVFNNRKEDRTQVKELLKKIDHMVQENGGSYYTNEMFQEAEAAIQKEKERIMKEKEEEMRREEEKIHRKYLQEMEEIMQRERQRQEEERRQMENKLRDMDEQMKREQELQKRREEELRKEMEQRQNEEMEQVRRRYEEEARHRAENNNSFLDKVVDFFVKVAAAVLPFIKKL